MIYEQIVALKDEDENESGSIYHSGIIYRLNLETPQTRYKEDRKVFRQIVNSWRRISETDETQAGIKR